MRGDCLELMKTLPDSSVDLILCDLPYGTTECKWDSVIPFDSLWVQYLRVLKPGSAIVLTAAQPFTTALVASNMRGFCYTWTWDKQFAGNFVQAKRMPLRVCEDVAVFSLDGRMPRYFPLMTQREKPIKAGGLKSREAIPNRSGAEAKQAVRDKIYTEKYPTNLLEFSKREGRGLHPTQKPVALMEYLIRTYTNEGDVVLDNCMGSGTTGVACVNTGRNFIGMEMDAGYFAIAQGRILAAMASPANDNAEAMSATA